MLGAASQGNRMSGGAAFEVLIESHVLINSSIPLSHARLHSAILKERSIRSQGALDAADKLPVVNAVARAQRYLTRKI
jgi:hypothetical protein